MSRAALAGLAGVSIGQLANIEQGAIPKRSRVLEAALAALSHVDPSTSNALATNQGAAKADGPGRRGS